MTLCPPDSSPPPKASVRRLIEWSDTDASGHYHYATAMRLFEAAESQLLATLGLLDELYGRLPRVHVSFDYRRILLFRDVVDTVVSVVELGRTSITYSLEVTKDGELCVEGSLIAVLVDVSGRPTAWLAHQRGTLDPSKGPTGRP